jgi:hypothetical protein
MKSLSREPLPLRICLPLKSPSTVPQNWFFLLSLVMVNHLFVPSWLFELDQYAAFCPSFAVFSINGFDQTLLFYLIYYLKQHDTNEDII